jgi:4-amino-4-deoxy-L-arabinose transferase-like glycosyltransferase
MDAWTYLTTPGPLGSLGWTFFIVQILIAGAGGYLGFMHEERNPARHDFLRRLGIGLLVVGVIGVVLGIGRLANLAVINQHLWFWVLLLVELAVSGFVFYYMRNILPGLERQQAGRARRPRPHQVTSQPAEPAEPRPQATTSRRGARRDRKRKGR